MQPCTASNSLGPVPCSLDVFLYPDHPHHCFRVPPRPPCTPRITPTLAVFQAWPDRREPPALRAAARLSNKGGDDDDYEQSQSCDVRLLFVSGTGLPNAARGELRDESDGGASTAAVSGGAAAASDMWGVLGRELWRPWPQADVVVHTGSQVKDSYSFGGRSFLPEGMVAVMLRVVVVRQAGLAGLDLNGGLVVYCWQGTELCVLSPRLLCQEGYAEYRPNNNTNDFCRPRTPPRRQSAWRRFNKEI